VETNVQGAIQMKGYLMEEEEKRIMCDYYRVEKIVTNEFSREWLDEIEKQTGVRPVIVESLIMTPDVDHHLCSARRQTLAWSMGYTLVNYTELDEQDGSDGFMGAEAVEHTLLDVYHTEGCHARYYGYTNFWSEFQGDNWECGVRIPDRTWKTHPEGHWIEYMGTYDEANIQDEQTAFEIHMGEYEEEDNG